MPLTVADVNAVLTLTGVFMRLFNDGLLTSQRIRQIAAEEGASPEELFDLDARLSEAITRREKELEG